MLLCIFADQERHIRDMLTIVEGNPSDSDEVKNPAKEKEQSPPSVAKTRYDSREMLYYR